MNQLILAVADVTNLALNILTFAVIVRAVFSWIRPDPYNKVVRFIIKITDPVLVPLSRYIPSFGGIDITPIAAIFLIHLLQTFVIAEIVNSLVYNI